MCNISTFLWPMNEPIKVTAYSRAGGRARSGEKVKQQDIAQKCMAHYYKFFFLRCSILIIIAIDKIIEQNGLANKRKTEKPTTMSICIVETKSTST